MIRFHRKYRVSHWSNSKLSHWIREKAGLDNPRAMSMEDWEQHHKDSKAKAPFINWLTDEFFNKVQRFVMFPLDVVYSVEVFYRNWRDKSHVLEGGFEVGQWVDRCTRINTCLFHELEKFIEKEKGLETLEWEKTLVYDESWGYSEDHEAYGKPTHQALAAMEQEAIYNWWKKNKNRDFFVESGLAEIYSNVEGSSIFSYMSATKDAKYDDCQHRQDELESQFKKEEESMLIRLIKIRDHLWS